LIDRIGYQLLRWGGVGIVLPAVVIPSAVTVVRSVAAGVGPAGGWGFSARQAVLLVKTVELAVPAMLLAVLLSVPVAGALGAGRRGWAGRALWALVGCPLLLPPTVLAFGWERFFLLFGWRPPDGLLCVWSWACWLWPIPAALLGSGWAVSGRAAYQAALLDTGRWRAFAAVGLPALSGHILAAGSALLVIFFADYNVPHACNLQVYATELLAWAANYPGPINVLWRSVPLVALLLVVALGVWKHRRHLPDGSSASDMTPARREVRARFGWCVCLVLVVGPQVGLLARLDGIGAFVEMGRTYRPEITAGLIFALVGGLAAVLTGLAVWTWGAWMRPGAIVLLVVGFLPAALFGKALSVGYVAVPAVYDHWPILMLAYAGRFAWIGVLTGWLIRVASPGELEQTARLDGGREDQVFWRVCVGTQWPVVVCAWLAAGGLCLAELAAVSQVALPQYGLLSMILIEKFHRFEEQMLVSLSLTLQVLPVLAALLLAGIVSGGRRGVRCAPS
jgi:ABC-type Fe3+ transport system permease subunit